MIVARCNQEHSVVGTTSGVGQNEPVPPVWAVIELMGTSIGVDGDGGYGFEISFDCSSDHNGVCHRPTIACNA